MSDDRPSAVRALDAALADWLGAFTAHGDLVGAMADACAAGGAWVGAIGATAVRRTGWTDPAAMAWGIAMGALAGAVEAARGSLAGLSGGEARGADGPARKLLAADGLVAAAHEALASLEPERHVAALEAIDSAMGNGAPWNAVVEGNLRGPSWAAIVPLAVTPAARTSEAGPWGGYALAWRSAFVAPPRRTGEAREAPFPDTELWERPDAGEETRALLEAAARAARRDPAATR